MNTSNFKNTQFNSDGARTSAILFRAPLLAIIVLGWLAFSARAQVPAHSQEVHIYAGGLFGDTLTDGTIGGRVPRLKDSLIFGGRYGYNWTPQWATELSLGHSFGTAKGTPAGNIDFGLTTVDFAFVRHLAIPDAPRYIPYFTAGVGYAFADLDQPIVGTRAGQVVSVRDRNSVTAVAGTGVKYMVNQRTMLRFDVRYRYVDKLTGSFDSSLNTVETTVGIGWRF